MHGGAVTLADRLLAAEQPFDAILATDMLDLSTLLALTRRRTADLPVVLYMHENQLTYPWSPQDRDAATDRDRHYAFINLVSALAADRVVFNSIFHRESFLGELTGFVHGFPDHRPAVDHLGDRSEVIVPGVDFRELDAARPDAIERFDRPLLLWNHRWEYDKAPQPFFEALFELQDRGVEFRLAVFGERMGSWPDIFDVARDRLSDRIVHWGHVADRSDYIAWMWRADILPVTSVQDFFGLSIVEAMACDVFPLLPHRLAYPEHIDPAYHRTFFYDDHRDLVNRLQRLIFDVALPRKMDVRRHIARYDLNTVIHQYDDLFDRITAA